MINSAHVETSVVTGQRLGLRVSDPSKQRLELQLTGVTPAHPTAADHLSQITNWGVLGNDKWGDCGPAAVAHYVMMITKYLTGTMVSPSLNDVLALYKLCNPDFNPTTGAGDNGVDMGEMLGFVCANGIGGKKALAHATVQVSSIDTINSVISIFGGALLAVQLETAQQAQTNAGMWDYQPSPIWGGHAVLAGRYSGATSGSDVAVVTWGQVCGTTDSFEQHQLSECHVLIFPEHLGTVAFQQGVDVSALAADYQALTGQKFPVAPTPPTPPPSPTPVPASAADQTLAAAIPRSWLDHPHLRFRDANTVADALKAWLISTGQL